jgi:exodeoxyribonuclease III
MKIATWNVNSLKVRLPHLLAWLEQSGCDIVCLQETKMTDDKFPLEALIQAGFHVEFEGQKTYNGVAIVSRLATTPIPIDVQKGNPNFADQQKRLIAATYGDLRIVNGYFPNGQALDSDKFVYKMQWLDELHNWCQTQLQTSPNFLLLGDFNIAPTDADVHDPALWAGQLHCSPAERAQFEKLVALGLHDTFRLFEQAPKLFSWWDYRQLGFRRNAGLRIDHILASEALKTRVISAMIDKAPRKLEQPSDHTPVIIELATS